MQSILPAYRSPHNWFVSRSFTWIVFVSTVIHKAIAAYWTYNCLEKPGVDMLPPEMKNKKKLGPLSLSYRSSSLWELGKVAVIFEPSPVVHNIQWVKWKGVITKLERFYIAPLCKRWWFIEINCRYPSLWK